MSLNEDKNQLLRSAQAGDKEAQYELGRAYHQGLGVAKDHEEALKWYFAASLQGSPLAAHSVGELFDDEQFPVNYVEAAAWFTIAAGNMPHSVKRIGELLPYMTELDAINTGLRASVIFSGLRKKLDLASCVELRGETAPRLQPKDGGSVATMLSILLPFHTSSGTPQSKYLLLRELTEGDSPLFVCGRLLNPTEHAQGSLPAVSIECLKTEVGNSCIHAYSTLSHFNIAFPSGDFTPIQMAAKNVAKFFDSLGANVIYVDRGRPCDFYFSKAPGTK
jgi:hypothetical protein